MEKNSFQMQYCKGCFVLKYPEFSLRFYKNPFSELVLEGSGYFLRRNVQSGDVIVDAGTYEGALTILMAMKTGPNGKVIAFEPDPCSASRLKANIALNNLENIAVVEKALWDDHGKASWENLGQPDARATSESSLADAHHVALTTLDQALGELGVSAIDFLKMDIEGAELRALRGAKTTLTRSRAHVAIASYHQDEIGMTAPRVEEYLRKLGYQCETGNPQHLTTWGWR